MCSEILKALLNHYAFRNAYHISELNYRWDIWHEMKHLDHNAAAVKTLNHSIHEQISCATL